MNASETAVLDTIHAELRSSETRLSSIPWELQQTYGIWEPPAVCEASLSVVAGLLRDVDVGIYELRDDFVPWPEKTIDALRRLRDTRTRDDAENALRALGWDDEPMLFLLRHTD